MALNSDQLFTTGSSIKVFPGGTAFATLGAEHRFRTRVFRTGPVQRGVLRGDLVLVASGDLLLGGRIQPDGTLALPEPDHSYGAEPLPGDPLRSLVELARQVRRAGIRRVAGRVRVDASLFRPGRADIAIGVGEVPIVPIMINDNLIDVTVIPAEAAGRPAQVRLSPDFGFLELRSEVITVDSADALKPLSYDDDTELPDGRRRVRLTGTVQREAGVRYRPYYLPDPVRFAELAFAETLRGRGIRTDQQGPLDAEPDLLRQQCTPDRRLAELVSPPLSEAVRPMLKVSSNLHTAYFPYLVGAIAGGDPEQPRVRGLQLQREFLARGGLDPDPPGADDHLYTPDYFVPYLSYLTEQPFFEPFRKALPIMGRDGTLSQVQVDSPAAGHVFAKTGSSMGRQPDGRQRIAKALAGYVRLPDESLVVFAEFMECFTDFGQVPAAGEALGEIVTAVYEELA